jgi:hypothetical protein
MKKFVARYDNGSGFMEFSGAPVESTGLAQQQAYECLGVSQCIDIVKVSHDGAMWVEQGDPLAKMEECGWCGQPNIRMNPAEECHSCGGV